MPPRLPVPTFGAISARPPPALPGQRIGLMGGSFNPPHDGHAVVARTALKRLRLDSVWWLVTPGNPLKRNDELPSIHTRMRLCERLVPERTMRITDFEARLGTPFTAATLGFLVRRYPGTRFVWVMGADNLASLHRWRDWRRIAELMPMAVVDRPGWRLKALASPAALALSRARRPEQAAARLARSPAPAWTFLTARLSKTSSTALRAGIVAK